VLSADADTKHGGNSHLALIDELHVQPNRDLVDVLQTSMARANRPQPLLVHITTADFDRESICNEKHDYACKVRDGIIVDEAFLPVIYEVARRRLDDEEVWGRRTRTSASASRSTTSAASASGPRTRRATRTRSSACT
jgi:phage terminase large subunit-like protein